jgi:murein DD-endopeptidase MepM/ murein hydrolase activator NlpD
MRHGLSDPGIRCSDIRLARSGVQGLWTWITCFLTLALPLSATAAQGQTRPPRVVASVHLAPTPVAGFDGVHLVYELHVINTDRRTVWLTGVDVLTADGTVLQTQGDSALLRNLWRGPAGQDMSERARIDSGLWAIVWLWVTVPGTEAVPDVLRHRLALQYDDGAGGRRTASIEVGTTVPGPAAIVIGPPLRGGYWRASNLSNASGHRRALETGGTISQRFAIDYFRVDEFGRNSSIDLFVNENHFNFGADVLAVADGVVVSAADSMAENRVGRQPARSWPATGGNYIDIAIGQGLFAQYLHLQSGSVRVQVGDTVTQGQVIGRVGNTGASVAPHLHFQLETTAWEEGRAARDEPGEGVPYVHPSYESMGQARMPMCHCEGVTCVTTLPGERTFEMPMQNNVIRFPGSSGLEPAPRDMSSTRHRALCRAAEGRLLGSEGRIAEAISAYEEARILDPTMEIPAEHLAWLCWAGSLSGQAARVMDVCDLAVASEPAIGDMKRGRGLARALMGDLNGAVRDFEAYIDWLTQRPPLAWWQTRLDGLTWGESFEVHRSHAQTWLDALRAGQNPFTADVLEELRDRSGG